MNPLLSCALIAFSMLTTSVVALAADPQTKDSGSTAHQRYEEERAYCLSGQSQQDRATCLREATNAYDQARKGGLETTGSTDYRSNAMARCDAQPPADRRACRLLVRGQGSQDGSVQGGGVIREIELPVTPR
jgi:hypothetical protein